jgi:hypothetical protein
LNSLAARYRLFARHRAWLPFVSGGMLAIAAWLFLPSIYNPYVRVGSSQLDFSLACMPESIQVDLLSQYARPRDALLNIALADSHEPVTTIPLQIKQQPSGKLSHSINLSVSPAQAPGITTQLLKFKTQGEFRYTIHFERTPNLDIQQMRLGASTLANQPCIQSTYSGVALMQLLRTSRQMLMRYKLMQDILSDLILLFNGSLANIFLAAMVVALLWLGFLFTGAAKRLYLNTDKTLLDSFNKRVANTAQELKKQGAEAVLSAQFQMQNRNFVFAKTMGPVFGFLLTVSSLSAALHPTVQAEQDTFHFISGIQVAIVATFIGLAIRIVAQFAQRVHRDLAERVLLLLRRAASATP